MAKKDVKKPTRNSKAKKDKEKELEIQEIEEVEEVEEDEVEEVETEDKDSAEAFVDKMMSEDNESDEDSEDDDAEEIQVDVKKQDDSQKSTTVLVIKDTDRFFVGTQWIEPLKRDEKKKLPKHVAEHLQERGRVKIV